MSKSLGNFFTVRDLLDRGFAGEVIRFVFLSTHYRKPMDWTDAKAQEAEKTLRKWRGMTDGVPAGEIPQAVLQFVADDLNTAGVLTVMHQRAADGDVAGLKAAGQLIGLLSDDMGDWVQGVDLGAFEAKLWEARVQAMDSKDFSDVDRIKGIYQAAGLEVRMSKTGVTLIAPSGFNIGDLGEV